MTTKHTTLDAFAFLVDELEFERIAIDNLSNKFGSTVTYRRGLDVVTIGTTDDWRDPEYRVMVNGKKIFKLYKGWGVPGALDPAIEKLRKLFSDQSAKDIRVFSVIDFRMTENDCIILVGKYENLDVFEKDRILVRTDGGITGSGSVQSASVSHGNQALIVSGLKESQVQVGSIVSRIVKGSVINL